MKRTNPVFHRRKPSPSHPRTSPNSVNHSLNLPSPIWSSNDRLGDVRLARPFVYTGGSRRRHRSRSRTGDPAPVRVARRRPLSSLGVFWRPIPSRASKATAGKSKAYNYLAYFTETALTYRQCNADLSPLNSAIRAAALTHDASAENDGVSRALARPSRTNIYYLDSPTCL